MIQELLYTSAPKGLKPGSRGFCTVLSTSGMPAPVATTLESLSGYRPVYPPGDPRVDQNPVVHSHLILSLAGKRSSVLSRVADYGLDYSQRTNKLAHHVVLDPQQRPAGGPAWLLQSPDFMRTEWNGELEVVPGTRAVPQGDTRIAICQAWQQLTGDAGWAGVLAESFLSDSPRQAFLVFEPGQNLLPLIAEVIALLPAARRWEVTFSTYFTKLPQGASCLWRCVLAGSAEANESRRHVQALRIDFTKPLGRAEGGPLVEAARTGSLPTAQPAADSEAATGATPPPPPSPDDAPLRLQETQAGRPGSAPPPRLPLEARIAARQQRHPQQRSNWKIWAGVLMLLIAVGGLTTVMLLQGNQPAAMENSLAENEGDSTANTPATGLAVTQEDAALSGERPGAVPAEETAPAVENAAQSAPSAGEDGSRAATPAADAPSPAGDPPKPAMAAVTKPESPPDGDSQQKTEMSTADGGNGMNSESTKEGGVAGVVDEPDAGKMADTTTAENAKAPPEPKLPATTKPGVFFWNAKSGLTKDEEIPLPGFRLPKNNDYTLRLWFTSDLKNVEVGNGRSDAQDTIWREDGVSGRRHAWVTARISDHNEFKGVAVSTSLAEVGSTDLRKIAIRIKDTVEENGNEWWILPFVKPAFDVAKNRNPQSKDANFDLATIESMDAELLELFAEPSVRLRVIGSELSISSPDDQSGKVKLILDSLMLMQEYDRSGDPRVIISGAKANPGYVAKRVSMDAERLIRKESETGSMAFNDYAGGRKLFTAKVDKHNQVARTVRGPQSIDPVRKIGLDDLALGAPAVTNLQSLKAQIQKLKSFSTREQQQGQTGSADGAAGERAIEARFGIAIDKLIAVAERIQKLREAFASAELLEVEFKYPVYRGSVEYKIPIRFTPSEESNDEAKEEDQK